MILQMALVPVIRSAPKVVQVEVAIAYQLVH
jgi:hypothetical protein